MQRGASLGRAMVSLATRGAPAHLARARSGATATTSSLTRASSHNGARHHAAWSLQPSHPTPRPPHRATRGRPSSPPVVARSSTTDSTSTSAIKGDRVTLPPPGDVHLWIMDPADAADPALCRDYRERCLPASERDALESEAANMTEGALRQATHSKALMRWGLARYCGGGVAPADLRCAHGEHGKPRLVGVGGGATSSSSYPSASHDDDDDDDDAWTRIRFSVSHTNRLVVLAVTSAPGIEPALQQRWKPCGSPTPSASPGWGANVPANASHEVGVDCEDERRRTSAAADKLAGRWLSALEHDALKAIGDDDARASAFMRTWTLKEAYVKALGTGIAAHPFGGFDVTLRQSDGSSKVSAGLAPPSSPGVITLTERSGTSAVERRAWAATASRWRMALLKPRADDSLLVAVCADGGSREGSNDASAGMNVRVRWTVPMVGDVAEGTRPPPTLIARSEGFGALE